MSDQKNNKTNAKKYRSILKKREEMNVFDRLRVIEKRLDYLEKKSLSNNDNKLSDLILERFDHESIV